MKLVTYSVNQSLSCGIMTPQGIIDIPSAMRGCNPYYSVMEIILAGSEAIDALRKIDLSAQETIAVESVQILPPIQRPGKLFGLAGNYKKHLEETKWQEKTTDDQEKTTNPWPFLMPSTTVIGHQAQIPWPAYSEEIDHEIELAVVIGKTARCVSPQKAKDCIAGYTIANDISARSTTFKAGRKDRPRDAYFDWLMGKWADGFLPLGPCLVTADAIGDPHNLAMELTVNGTVRQQANTGQMIFDVFQVVSFISFITTLEPGDVISTGTVQGVGWAADRYLEPGDKIDCTIDGIGTLSNTLGHKPCKMYRAFITG